MQAWLRQLRTMAPAERGVRLIVLGGFILLFLIVLVDAFGSRSRAEQSMQRAQIDPPAAEAPGPSVPSVYRVPRDLASEATLAAQAGQQLAAAPVPEDPAPVDPSVTESAVAAPIEEPAAPEVAEPEMAEDPVQDLATEEVAEEMIEEEADAPQVTEAETTEEAPEVIAADAVPEEAAAPQDLAAADATEETAEPQAAEAEITEAATDVAAEDATTEEAPAAEIADAPSEALGDDPSLALLASADLANGESVWRQCRACHVHDAEQNRGGPHLVGIIGRNVGVAEGWRYSRALSEHGGVWTVESLLAWLENPDSYIPGNQMAFRGLRNEQDRIDVLGFLNASGTN